MSQCRSSAVYFELQTISKFVADLETRYFHRFTARELCCDCEDESGSVTARRIFFFFRAHRRPRVKEFYLDDFFFFSPLTVGK